MARDLASPRGDRRTGLSGTRVPPGPFAPDDFARARRLVLRCGWNSTAYQLLNPGFTRWFSSAGDALVGYVVAGGIAVAGGAPVAARERVGEAAGEFEAAMRRAGYGVCWLGAGARLLDDLDPRTHARIRVGAQPWWRPERWAQAVGRHASLRAQFNRARNKGVTVAEWPGDRAAASRPLARCLREWLDAQGLPPLHFLVEPDLIRAPLDRRIFVAQRNHDAVAYLVLTPIPARDGWLVEQVVRSPRAPNGTTELLVDAAARAVHAEGAGYFTLGVAPLSTRAGQSGGPAWLRAATAWTRAHGRRFYNFGGLEAFKAKFRPDGWEPAWLITDEPRIRPRHLWAIAGAYAGGSPLRALGGALARAAREERRRAVARVTHRRLT
jgi:phosphatidylglycerol lysyltransferase